MHLAILVAVMAVMSDVGDFGLVNSIDTFLILSASLWLVNPRTAAKGIIEGCLYGESPHHCECGLSVLYVLTVGIRQ